MNLFEQEPIPFQDYRIIPLTKGQVALVSIEDYERVSAHKWCAIPQSREGGFRAVRRLKDGTNRLIYMHRFVMGLENGDPREADHVKPEDTLDNRRTNLRICEKIDNMRNRRKNKNNKTGFKGVSFSASMGKFRAYIVVNYKQKHLGMFNTAESAHNAYIEASKDLHGEFGNAG